MEQWYVLFSKPHKESLVRDQLSRRGLRAYLPLVTIPGARRRAEQPLFPRYLFARLDLGRTPPDTIRWTPGLTSLVAFDGELATVDEALIAHIEQRLRQIQQQPYAPLRPGQRVCLPKDHPLAALDAVFERPLSGGERASILVQVLGRLMRCVVNRDLLQAADRLAYALG